MSNYFSLFYMYLHTAAATTTTRIAGIRETWTGVQDADALGILFYFFFCHRLY